MDPHITDDALEPETQELTSAHLTSGHGLRTDVASGLRWGAFDQVVQAAVRLGVAIALTRLIDPDDFGVMGIASIVVALCSVLTGVGLGDALVQREDLRPAHVRSAFTTSAITGVVLMLGTIAASSSIASFFGEPDLRAVLVALSVVMLFQGLERTPNDLLSRALQFRRFYLSSTIAAAVGGVVGLAMAAGGAGVWALVGMAIGEAVTAAALGWLFAISGQVWRPSVGIDRRALRELLGFSGYLTADRTLGFALDNGDNLLIGRMLGAEPLGFYSLAYRVILVPIQRIAKVMQRAAFPALARVQEDTRRLRDAYLQANRYVAVTCMPIMIGAAVTGHSLVPVVFGEKWRPAAVALELLAVSGPALLVTNLSGALYRSTGHAQWGLARTAISACAYLPAFFIGAQHGINGVAAGFTIASYVCLPLDVWLSGRATQMPGLRVLTNVAPVALATGLMAAAAGLTGWLLSEAGDTTRLAAMVVVGIVTYAGGALVLFPDTLRAAWQDVRRTAT